MKALLLATTLALAPAAALAAPVITFGQTSGANTITATASATGTSFAGSDVGVSISQIDAALATPLPAFLSITATSEAAGAQSVGGAIVQHFDGTFHITSASGGGGTNYLSGAFNDAAITAVGATSVAVFAIDALFTSDVVTDLGLPRSVSLALTNVSPAVSLAACGGCGSGETLAGFTASIAGNASANAPEPASLAIMGVGLLGLGMVRRRG